MFVVLLLTFVVGAIRVLDGAAAGTIAAPAFAADLL
jgi:hypothetical protein